ncbi:MAG: GMC family oxidoreductase [Alphaproteobacteria bacterium]|nr:GMC family oxidoreductase [Alphaproteobacteria bacterium]
MFEDARRLADKTSIEADICVIGAGAAGITIASGFVGTGRRVCVIESGGLDFDSNVQRLHKGINTGLYYEPLDLCRVRGFGGSTGPQGWGGWCKPLASIDFSDRPWLSMPGWPFGRQELDAYYQRAFSTLSLPPETERIAQAAEGGSEVLQLANTVCRTELCALSPQPHLGHVSRDLLRAAPNVRVLLYANATLIATDPAARAVTSVQVATLAGNTLDVTARFIVLAAGGIENPRLLLLSDQVNSRGLGNHADLVGRCFMEHPRFSWGSVTATHLAPLLLRYDPGSVVRQRKIGASQPASDLLFGAGVALDEATQRNQKILNGRSWIVPTPESGEHESGREFKEIVFWLKKRRIPADLGRRLGRVARNMPNVAATIALHLRGRVKRPRRWQFITVMEQDAYPDSRVTLDRSRDALGLRKVRLHWRIGALTEESFRRTRRLLVANMKAAGVNCEMNLAAAEAEPVDEPRWVWHHMGTTRMSRQAGDGVVDPNCRLHGMENLYVAGSSVFPTGGNDMPTLTIVALAHRLTDHLRSRLAE